MSAGALPDESETEDAVRPDPVDGTATKMLGISVRSCRERRRPAVSKKFLVSRKFELRADAVRAAAANGDRPDVFRRWRIRRRTHCRCDAVNMACASAEPSSAGRAAAAARTIPSDSQLRPPDRILTPDRLNGGVVRWLVRSRGGFRRDHVVQLAPLRRRHAPSIAACAALRIAGPAGDWRRSPIRRSQMICTAGIARECARQQLEGGEVATPHDDESRVAHRMR